MMTMWILSILATATQGVHTPTAETDGISVDVPDTFIAANRSHTDNINFVEMVRPPETLQTWSQMISVVTVMNAAESTSVSEFYRTWRDAYRVACPGPKDTVRRGTVDGKPALKAALFCPLDAKTGKPEHLTFIAVQGDVNILTVQLSFRRYPTSADSAMIERVSKSLKLCDARERASCSARRAKGFLPNP